MTTETEIYDVELIKKNSRSVSFKISRRSALMEHIEVLQQRHNSLIEEEIERLLWEAIEHRWKTFHDCRIDVQVLSDSIDKIEDSYL